MNKPKNILFHKRFTVTLLVVVSIFSAVLYSACRKTPTDPCKDIHCINGGACNSGKCVCPTGFSGTYCEVADDPCLKVTCLHGGTCNKGVCSCPTGYEGTNCETLTRDKFIGAYKGSEGCTIGSDNYTLTISAQTSDMLVTLTNVYDNTPVLTATGTVAATDSFTFAGSDGTLVYSGSGRVTGNSLSLHYSISDGTSTNSCMFIGFK